MNYSITASISYRAAAKLLIAGEIDLSQLWPLEVANNVLDALLSLSPEDILHIVDTHTYGEVADVKLIPQFGLTDILPRVPYYFIETGNIGADYAQMGFFLKGDPTAKLDANIKYGENYGKCAALLGIVNCVEKRFTTSSLSAAFCSSTPERQQRILSQLAFRIPIIQILLRLAHNSEINGFVPMSLLKESTQLRRGTSVRALLSLLPAKNSPALQSRLNNIIWEII